MAAEVTDTGLDIISKYEVNYKVKLEIFEGPLDLLLHLIKKTNLISMIFLSL